MLVLPATTAHAGEILSQAERLPTRALVGYGLSATPVIYAYVLVLIMYMKYAAVELGISTAVIGTIFLVAKGWDAVTDPMVGWLSDRTRSPRGRRRPWLVASAPLLALTSIALWAPPTALEGPALIAWVTVAAFGFYTAYTIFEVPHMALGAELSLAAIERNRIFGLRQALRVVGMMVAAAVGTTVIALGEAPTRQMAWLLAIATLALIWLGVALLPRERAEFRGRGARNPFRAVRDVVENRHARLLLLVLFIDQIGTGGIGVLTPFVLHYVADAEALVPALLVANMVASLLAIPVWLRLARRYEKKTLLLASMIGSGVGYGFILTVGHGDWLRVLVSAIVAGASSACPNCLGYTLKSEIIDFDEYETGERKEGAYFAGWSFVGKLAGGVMVGLVGWSLDLAGFDGQVEEQTVLVQQTMVALMGGVPLVCYLIGALIFRRFDLSESEHARIRAALDERTTHRADGPS